MHYIEKQSQLYSLEKMNLCNIEISLENCEDNIKLSKSEVNLLMVYLMVYLLLLYHNLLISGTNIIMKIIV